MKIQQCVMNVMIPFQRRKKDWNQQFQQTCFEELHDIGLIIPHVRSC